MMARHYAPRTHMTISANPVEVVAEMITRGEQVGWLALSDPGDELIASLTCSTSSLDEVSAFGRLTVVKMPLYAAAYSSVLYYTLHDLDDMGLTRIVVEEPPDAEDWIGIRDRLSRASSPQIVACR